MLKKNIMSVVLHGKEYKVKKKKGMLTLNLSKKGIKNISEIKGLENLTKLEVLNLWNNQISDIKGLESLLYLWDLNLAGNSITEIKGLETLLYLKKLSLGGNTISEIKGFEALVNLEVLFLPLNPIETLKGLDNLVNLTFINLYNCKIHEIESFKNKEYLKQTILGKNPIYEDLTFAISKKKKLSRMTEEERKIAGVNPNVWEVATNCPGKILKSWQPKQPWYAYL